MILNFFLNESGWVKDFIPTILGAIIGGLFAFLGSNKATQNAHKNNLDILERKNKEVEKAVILSIGEELKGLFEIYHTEFTDLFASLASQPFLTTYYKVTLDPCVIYNANADKIGCISNNRLRSMIINLYTFLRKFIEELKIYDTTYNDLCRKRISVLDCIDQKSFNGKILANLDTQNLIENLQQYINEEYGNKRDAISKPTDLKIYDFLQNDQAETKNLHILSIELKNLYEKIVDLNNKIQEDIVALGLRKDDK